MTHQVHQDGQILHVTVSHQGRNYVGALVLESRWSVYSPTLHCDHLRVEVLEQQVDMLSLRCDSPSPIQEHKGSTNFVTALMDQKHSIRQQYISLGLGIDCQAG